MILSAAVIPETKMPAIVLKETVTEAAMEMKGWEVIAVTEILATVLSVQVMIALEARALSATATMPTTVAKATTALEMVLTFLAAAMAASVVGMVRSMTVPVLRTTLTATLPPTVAVTLAMVVSVLV